MAALEILRRVGRRGLAAAAGTLLVLAALVATPGLLGSRVDSAIAALGSANPRWLWLAGAGFVVSLLASAGSWRAAIGLCGARLPLLDAAARYGAGSFVNTLLPARAGDAVRFGLFARTLDGEERLLRAGGAFVALGAARAIALGALVVAGAALGALPLWPVLALGGVAVAGAGLAVAARRSTSRRAARILDAFRTLGREPRAAARLVGWLALAVAGRVVAAASVGAALGIGHPFAAALVIVPALDVAGILPLTPANVGITSGAVAVAFAAHGIPFAQGLAAGLAFHAVETAVGLSFGFGSLLWLAPYPSPGIRRVALLAAGASAFLSVAGALSATVLLPLV